MANQYFNFYYSPSRQGLNATAWRTLFGTPAVSNNKLMVSQAGLIHYGDILRADAVFNFNIAAPATALSKKFGFFQPNKNDYAWFNISGADFTAECSNGTSTTVVAITWQSAWTNVDTEFRIKWEAGTTTFFVGGIQQAVINDASVAGDPMSLYMVNNYTDTAFLNYIDVKTIQSYMISDTSSTSTFENLIYGAEKLTISESVTVLIPTLFAPAAGSSLFDSLTVSENVAIERLLNITVSDLITTTESVTTEGFESLNVNDSLTITDVPTMQGPRYTINVSDSLTITESKTIVMP